MRGCSAIREPSAIASRSRRTDSRRLRPEPLKRRNPAARGRTGPSRSEWRDALGRMCLATLAGGRLNSRGFRRGAPVGFPEGGDPLGPSGARMEGGEGPMRSRHGSAGSGRRSREIEGESARAAAGRAGPFERVGEVLSAFPAPRLSGEPQEEIQRGVLRPAGLIGIAGRKPCVRESGALRGCGRGRRRPGVGRRVRRDGRGERQGGDESGKGLHCSYPFNSGVSFHVEHPRIIS